MRHWARKLLVLPIRFYRRFLSPLKPRTCRFKPTCSAYAQEAIGVHGVIRGSGLAIWRILRCNPFGGTGYDPIPRPRGAESRPTPEDPPTS